MPASLAGAVPGNTLSPPRLTRGSLAGDALTVLVREPGQGMRTLSGRVAFARPNPLIAASNVRTPVRADRYRRGRLSSM